MGLEQLLLVLFILFSIVSSLLERRKRQRRLEEARQKQRQQAPAAEPALREAETEATAPSQDQDWGGWPVPPGDPFEPRPSPRRHPQPVAPGPVETGPPPTSDAPALLRELERQAHQAEAQAQRQEEAARTRQRQAQAVRSRRLEHERMHESRRGPMHAGLASPGADRRRSRYRLTPATARDAVVWAEILGPCKAERKEENRW